MEKIHQNMMLTPLHKCLFYYHVHSVSLTILSIPLACDLFIGFPSSKEMPM